jgi:hypothetical protein
MKKLLLGFLLLATLLPAANKTDQFNLSYWLYKPVSVTGYIRASGVDPLTANWNIGAFTLTGLNLTATPTLSAEALTNVAGWTAAGNWTYAAGTIWSHATGSATALTATGETAVAIGTKYEITMVLTTSVTGGGLAVSLGGQTFAVVSASGSYTFNVTAASTAALAITPTSGTWVGSLTISVKLKTAATGVVTAEGITLNSGQLLAPNGNNTYPSFSFTRYPAAGMTAIGAASFTSASIQFMGPDGQVGLSIGSTARTRIPTLYIGADYNLPLVQDAAATLQLGIDAAAPVDQTIKGPDGSGNDKPGGGFSVEDGAGTGAGAGVGVKLRTAYSLPVAATAATLQTKYTRKWEVAKTWAIVDAAAAVPIITITCPAGGFVNGKIIYSLECIDHDGAEMQCESGEVTFAALQHAAGAAYHIAAPSEVSTQSVSTGTLATSWTMTSGSNVVVLNFAADSDMDFTTAPATGHIWLRIQIILNSPQTITLN